MVGICKVVPEQIDKMHDISRGGQKLRTAMEQLYRVF